MGALGLDVGSTTAKVVVLGDDGRLGFHAVARHHGRPRDVALELLARARDAERVASIGVTGSIGIALGEELGAATIHEVEAVVAAAKAREPEARSIVELGGQDAKLVLVGEDAQMNDRCAAGTGATLDRVARRLGMSGDELAALRLSGDLRVAAKCGVFAERDVVNLVKLGASKYDALSALLRAIVVQNLAVLARGRAIRAPVLLLGGPLAHVPALGDAFREALASLWQSRGLDAGDVRAPEHAALFAALGAAACGRTEPLRRAAVRRVLSSPRADAALVDGDDPSSLSCAEEEPTLPRGRLAVHLGLDAGSTTSKAVLLSNDGVVLAYSYAPSCGDPLADARDRLDALFRDADATATELEVRSFGVTGYGAPIVEAALGADASVVETIAHAKAAAHAAEGTEVVVDVGGTDVKVMRLDGERVTDFHLSNQCAAGLGAFVAGFAADLGVPVEAIATAAFRARRAPRFTVGCAVFLDTDRVTFQRDGYTPDELLAGVARALVRNVWEFVVPVPPASLGRKFLLTGGAHKNLAIAWSQAQYLRARVPGAVVRVHPRPELCGAIGAALVARDRVGVTRFVGIDVARRVEAKVTTSEATRCTRCEIGCARSILSIASPGRDATLVVGNACERGADAGATGERTRAHAPDLFADEGERLFRPILPRPNVPALAGAPVFGVPRVMGLYRCAPLLLHYLRALGVPDDHVVLTPPTSAALFQEGARRGSADPCFPAKLVLSHVDWLLRAERSIDVLLMPTVTHARIAPHGTTDTASCPIVAACGHTSSAALRRERRDLRSFSPELTLSDPKRLDAQLFAAFHDLLGVSREMHERAFAHGIAAQNELGRRLRLRAERVLARARKEGTVVAVVLARPYHADPGIQHGVSSELAARGVPVLGIASLPVDDLEALDLSRVAPQLTNSGDAEKLWATRLVARIPNLVAVELSSFKCGQDAGAAALVGDRLAETGKPVLRLHDLDEDRATASLRIAIETFVETVRTYERLELRGSKS